MNNKSAEKRQRQNEVRRLRNKTVKSRVRTEIKKYLHSLDSGNHEEAQKLFISTVKIMDRACGKGVFHKNTVARKKSRLAKRLNTVNTHAESRST